MRDNLHNKHNKQFSLHEKIMEMGRHGVRGVRGTGCYGGGLGPFLPSNKASKLLTTF